MVFEIHEGQREEAWAADSLISSVWMIEAVFEFAFWRCYSPCVEIGSGFVDDPGALIGVRLGRLLATIHI